MGTDITRCMGMTLLTLLLCVMTAAGNRGRPLQVGDKMPDYTFINLVNYPSATAKVSDFRGKLLLIDFWSTGCVACVESWPKLERLQQDFSETIQILLVNPWQSRKVVQPFMDRRRAAGVVDLTLPSVCQDSMLLQLFHVASVPHIVWVDAQGMIRSISSGAELHAANIRSMLAGDPVTMPQKTNLGEVSALPEAPDDRVLWQSTFSSFRDAMANTVDAFARPDVGYFMRVINSPVRELYRYAYSRDLDRHGYLRFIPLARVQLTTRDSVRLKTYGEAKADRENQYCYELVSGRPTSLTVLQARMQHDLQGQFPYQAHWQKQVKRCLVFSVTDSVTLRYKEGGYALAINDTDFHVNKVTVTELIQNLEDITAYANRSYPLVDETNFPGKMGGIRLTVNVYNVESLRRALLPYGLSLHWADRTVEVLVISDRPERTDR